MSLIPHHSSDQVCPLCELKLKDAHEEIASWFRKKKTEYPDLHCSWTFRDHDAQELCFKEGKSKLHFPQSGHNRMRDGKPCAIAIDIFQIGADGRARFDPVFCARLASDNEKERLPIKWGKHFKGLIDSDHFELDFDSLVRILKSA